MAGLEADEMNLSGLFLGRSAFDGADVEQACRACTGFIAAQNLPELFGLEFAGSGWRCKLPGGYWPSVSGTQWRLGLNVPSEE